MAISLDYRVDVNVSLGTQPISTASFDSAAFIADLLDADFANPYKVYSSLTEVAADFATSSDTYKFAALAFGGNFRPKDLYVIKYGATNAIPLTPVQALNAQLAEITGFYWVGCDSHVDSDVTALAAACEAAYKMLVTSTQDADAIDPVATTDILSVLQDASYNHVTTMYHGSADTAFTEGGIVGAMAAIAAGTSTLEDKTLIGVTASNITTTARTALEDKNGGFYSTIAGVNSYFNSKVASGQFVDTIVFSDWFRARVQESVYGLLKRESDLGRKVSYDEAGLAKIRQAIFQPIAEAQANGAISADFRPVVRTPTREEVSDADRAGRYLPNVVVEVQYSNAIHKVQVRAYVSI